MSTCDPSNTACVTFLSIVAPLIGNIFALGLTLAPLRAVLQVQRTNVLGEMNPAFPIAMIPNSVINLAYAFLLSNWWIAAPNLTGLAFGLYYVLVLLRAIPAPRFPRYALALCGLTFISCFISSLSLIHFEPLSFDTARLVQGISATCFIVLFYAAPLLTMYQVIKERDSSSINIPIALAIGVNSAFWFLYGTFIRDPFVWAPNVLGFASGIAQVALALVFPRTKAGGKSWMTMRGKRFWRTLGRSSAQADPGEMERAGTVELGSGGGAEEGKKIEEASDAESERTADPEAASQRVETPSPNTAGSEEPEVRVVD
ncbi:sugar efflux transporter for intercellular exchange-domain-containing protein [Hyaloraphidium curvatum]|nr:sugar efflux transporter for intercellular exchange-domain-containing protein [Hyaloraphidium curvatum]